VKVEYWILFKVDVIFLKILRVLSHAEVYGWIMNERLWMAETEKINLVKNN
jgi:hypothetical protein